MDEVFDFELAEETQEESKSCNCREELKTTEQEGDTTKKGGKAKNNTWSDVVNGLKRDDELEITNSGESGSEREMFDSIVIFDSDTPNGMRAKQRRRHRKMHQHRESKGGKKGHMRRQAD